MPKAPTLTAVVLATALTAAAPAAAYYGPCYTDAYGRCTQAPISMSTPTSTAADSAAYGTTPDQNFAYHLTHDSSLPNYTITNFDLLKSQALEGCNYLRAGWRTYDVINWLQNAAVYPRRIATNIIIAGNVIYCPEIDRP
jgi:hypothetical protein